MDFWKSVSGMVELELTSAEQEQMLVALSGLGIEIHSIEQAGDLTCRFLIHRRNYKKVAALCEKRGETLRKRRETGMYWSVRRLINRPVMLFGIVLFLMGAVCFPSRIFFVRVEGNPTVPTRKIISAAEESGICFGASRREVRSEKVKNALLAAVPELQWAGVNTSGCVAVISVRERTITEQEDEKREVTSIVADRDGYILSATVTEGNVLVQTGQAVKEGQVLVSGYSDCGICIRATSSKAEILAQTNRSLEAIMSMEYMQRGTVREIKRKYSLLFGKKRLNLWKNSGILDSSCGRMYEEYYITLPGGFALPIALCIETFYCFETRSAQIEQEQAEKYMTGFADTYLMQQMVAGEIKGRMQTVVSENGVYRLNGRYTCEEMIGREQQEQIGDTNGKNG